MPAGAEVVDAQPVRVAAQFTPSRVERIILALQAGNTRTAAARYGGISPATMKDWLAEYPDFEQRVFEAEAAAEINAVALIQQAAKKRWVAAAWWLERRYPHEWGKIDRVELVVRQQQAQALAEELRAEGIEITETEILREYDSLSKRSLPPGGGSSAS